MATSMGSLKPGAKYVYESPDGGETVYARETGQTERVMIGQSYNAKSFHERLKEDQMWGDIRRAADTNPALQDALDCAIMIYILSKHE